VNGPGTVDLSMNETVFGPLPAVARALADRVASPQRYPDHGARALVAAIAGHVGRDPGQVVVGAGSAVLAQHLVTSLPGRDVLHPALSFEGYPLIAANAGARPVPVPMAADGLRPDLDALLAAVGPDTRCVLLCNPNSPTGAVLRRAELTAFLDALPAGVPVVLDEAYREFVTDPDVPDGADLARDREDLCVLRTFSKAFGLASLRVGYALVPAALAGPARTASLLSFPGGPAQAAAVAALEPASLTEVAARVAAVVAARADLAEGLAADGFAVAPGHGNFVWLPIGEAAEGFAARAAAAGVVVRAVPGAGVRITVADPAVHARLRAAVVPLAPVSSG
jgi:histidinol-phosphate aminotransferase